MMQLNYLCIIIIQIKQLDYFCLFIEHFTLKKKKISKCFTVDESIKKNLGQQLVLKLNETTASDRRLCFKNPHLNHQL